MSETTGDEDRLYREPALAQFYDLENGWADDLGYCRGRAQSAGSLLDLGCGTGLFLSRLEGKRRLVGVDPAAAMLEIARRRPGGETVTWIQADARRFRWDQSFDLIVLTGHAFQVFLSDADRRALLATIAAQLAPEGRFIFDSREPSAEAWRAWNPEDSRRTIRHPALGEVEAWNAAEHDPATGIVTYETHYRALSSGQRFAAESRIAFPSKQRIAALIEEAGLVVERWLGDWQGQDYDSAAREIIPIGRLR